MTDDTTYCAEEGATIRTLDHRRPDVVRKDHAPTLRESMEKLREAIDNVIESLGGEKGVRP